MSFDVWMWLVPAIALIALGWWDMAKKNKLYHEIERYKFDHRTSGGAVQYESYEASLVMKKKMRAHDRWRLAGVLALTPGIMAILYVVLSYVLYQSGFGQ